MQYVERIEHIKTFRPGNELTCCSLWEEYTFFRNSLSTFLLFVVVVAVVDDGLMLNRERERERERGGERISNEN